MAIKFHPSSGVTKIIIITELILVSYLLYTLTLSVYKSYQIDRVVQEFESENARLTEENQTKAEDLDYFTSPNYVEKIAKRNLNLVKPGEQVIILPKKSIEETLNAEEVQQKSDVSDLSNWEKWYVFLFDRNR